MNKTAASLLLILTMFISQLSLASPANSNESKGNVDQFVLLKKSKLNVVFYDGTEDFSRFKTIELLPIKYDRLALAKGTDDVAAKNWDVKDQKEMEKIGAFFDEIANKTFGESRVLPLATTPGGENSLAVEFRMEEFAPKSNQKKDALDTVGQSFNLMGLGTMKFHAVLVEAKSRKLVAVIEETTSINAGNYAGQDNKSSRNLAWKRSFKKLVDKFHTDLKKLKTQKK